MAGEPQHWVVCYVVAACNFICFSRQIPIFIRLHLSVLFQMIFFCSLILSDEFVVQNIIPSCQTPALGLPGPPEGICRGFELCGLPPVLRPVQTTGLRIWPVNPSL